MFLVTGQGSPVKLTLPFTPFKVMASRVELRDDIVSQMFLLAGQGSPVKLSLPTTPSKVTASGVELRDDIVKYYKDNGLDSFAKEVMLPSYYTLYQLYASVVVRDCADSG